MPFFYTTGEMILPGDRILLHDNPGEIELIADPDENSADWYVENFGGGVMVVEPRVFGRLFLASSDDDFADMKFVARRLEPTS
ncbi:hypothetical protein [Paludibaculum fermentans]|uniref:hypothetical protein n=1 Tax=Paludibaculum fermentans TaxID=1473598 RepID=UPI003EB6D137